MTGRDLPACRRQEDIPRLSGRRVRVCGKYVELTTLGNAASPPRFEGRAGIGLEDGGLVLLEPSWSPAGIRPDEERSRLAGRPAEAIGILHAEPVRPTEPRAFAHYVCLFPVESIAELD